MYSKIDEKIDNKNNEKTDNKCNNCLNNYKYKCPACNIKSCSLECVNIHKKKTGCDGDQIKKHINQNIPITKYNGSHLWKDFNFLEDVRRKIINIKRNNKDLKKLNKNNFQKNNDDQLIKVIKDDIKSIKFTPISLLKKACNKRNIKINFCPINEMNIRKTNTSYYDKKNDHLLWKMEFYIKKNDENSQFTFNNISENEIISQRLSQIIQDFDINKTKIFLINNSKDSNLQELEINKTFKDNFFGKQILEFPRINVILE